MLDDPAYMSDAAGDEAFADHANARLVYARLTDPARPMPPKPDAPWSREKLDRFKSWMDDGFYP